MIGFLIVLLLLPLAQVEDLVGERVGMRQTAAQRVAESWGGAQTTAGVLLAIPVETTRIVVEQTRPAAKRSAPRLTRNMLYVLPDTLKVDADARIRATAPSDSTKRRSTPRACRSLANS